MTGIFDRVFQQAKAAAHSVMDAIEDPTKTAEQIIRDCREDIAKAEDELVNIRASLNVKKVELQQAQEQTKLWEGRANKALDKNDDSLAVAALGEKKKADSLVTALTPQVAKIQEAYDKINARITKNRQQIDQLENRKDIMATEQATAKAVEHSNRVLNNIGTTGESLESFERLEKKVQGQVARADAVEQIAAERDGSSVEARFAALEADSTVTDELAALKAKRAAEGK